MGDFMRYKFFYYKVIRGEKIMTVMDFKETRMITFDLEALQSNELDEDKKLICGLFGNRMWRIVSLNIKIKPS